MRIHGISSRTPGLSRLRIGPPENSKEWTTSATWNLRTIYLICLTVCTVLSLLFAFAWFYNPQPESLWLVFAQPVVLGADAVQHLDDRALDFSQLLGYCRPRQSTDIHQLLPTPSAFLRCVLARLRLPRVERLAVLPFPPLLILLLPHDQMAKASLVWLVMFGICALVILLFPLRAMQTRTHAHHLQRLLFALSAHRSA